MNLNKWEAQGFEITVDGKMFFVNADFKWDFQAVDHAFDPSRGFAGMGRDLLAEVPVSIVAIEIFGSDDAGESVPLALVKGIREAMLSEVRESDIGKRGERWTKWDDWL